MRQLGPAPPGKNMSWYSQEVDRRIPLQALSLALACAFISATGGQEDGN